MRARVVHDNIQNALDFFQLAELAVHANPVALSPTRVTWHSFNEPGAFLLSHDSTTVAQYLTWLRGGMYSAVLRDASLLQLTYEVEDSLIVGHRLAYIPCPVLVDESLLVDGEPIDDVVSGYLDTGVFDVTLRSPIRFDFDAIAARPGHPAAHFSVNGPACRVACIAPVHPYRFLDFVFRHFYPSLHEAQRAWFEPAGRRHIGGRVITDAEREQVHLTWPV